MTSRGLSKATRREVLEVKSAAKIQLCDVPRLLITDGAVYQLVCPDHQLCGELSR